MAYKSTTFTSGGQGGARLIVEQTGVNSSYATLTAYVQILRSSADSYSAPTIDFTSIDAGYSWSGSRGNMSGTSWQTVYTKTGILVYYLGSSTTRSFTVAARGTYTYDATEEEGEVVTTSYGISGTFELYPKTSPTPVVNPSISVSASSCTLGSSINITTANGSAANITVKIGSNAAQTIFSSVGAGTISWAPSIATFASKIVSGSSATATLSWNGASTSITLRVPNNSSTVPTCTASVQVVNGFNGLYVKGKSQARVTVTPSTKYGATVSNYVISIDGTTYSSNPSTSSILTTAGSRSYSAYIKDSRGFTSSTVSGTFTVTDYASPTIGGVNIYRSNSSGTADNNGTYITYKFNNNITALGNANVKEYILEYKTESATTWTSAGSGTLTNYTGSNTKISENILSTTVVYQARIAIRDNYGTVYSVSVTIPTSEVIMDFNNDGTGGGLGMYTQASDFFDVNWKIVPHKGLVGVGAATSSYPNSGIYPVKYLSGSDLGSQTGHNGYVKAWLKKVCELYPNISHGIFIGLCAPSSVMIIICHIYNTSTIDSGTGLPRYSGGQAFGYEFGPGSIYTFRTVNYVYSDQYISST